MTVGIYETGRDRQPFYLQDLITLTFSDLTDFCDLAVKDTQVSPVPRVSATIKNMSALYYQIKDRITC